MEKKQIKLIVNLVALIPIIIGAIVMVIMIADVITLANELELLRILYGIPSELFYNDPYMAAIISEGYWFIIKNPLIISLSLFVVALLISGLKNTIIKRFVR